MGAVPTSLRRAIRQGDATRVEQLLQQAGDGAADLINNDYSQDCILEAYHPAVGNALYYAVFRGKTDIAELLLKYGADPNSTGFNDETVLHLAARSNHLQVVRTLLDCGSEIWQTDDLGRSVLHSAARSPFDATAVIKYLHDQLKTYGKEASNVIDVTDFAGRTALHDAVTSGTVANVKILLYMGANPQIRTKQGTDAHELAAKYNREDMLQLLMEHNTPKTSDETIPFYVT